MLPASTLRPNYYGGGCCEILAGEKWIIDKIFLKVHQEKQDIYMCNLSHQRRSLRRQIIDFFRIVGVEQPKSVMNPQDPYHKAIKKFRINIAL